MIGLSCKHPLSRYLFAQSEVKEWRSCVATEAGLHRSLSASWSEEGNWTLSPHITSWRSASPHYTYICVYWHLLCFCFHLCVKLLVMYRYILYLKCTYLRIPSQHWRLFFSVVWIVCDGGDSNHFILIPYCLNCYYTHIKCTTAHTHIMCTADYTYYLNTYHTHCVQYCVFESPPSHTVHDTALLLPQLQCTMYVHCTCTCNFTV